MFEKELEHRDIFYIVYHSVPLSLQTFVQYTDNQQNALPIRSTCSSTCTNDHRVLLFFVVASGLGEDELVEAG